MKNTAAANEALLELRSLSKSFGGLVAVDGVSFQIRKGEIVGRIGPNGAGKSTIVGCIMGVHRANKGDILFRGQSIKGLRADEVVAKGIARTFQVEKPLLNMTTRGNVMIGAMLHRPDREEALAEADRILDRVGLSRVSHVLAKNLTAQDRKRLELARALATRPSLLLLDEVVAGLTPAEIDQTLRLLRQLRDEGLSMLVIEHVMRAVMNISARVVVLDYGKLISEGSPGKVVEDSKVIEAYLGKRGGKLGASHTAG
jgi:branched-chain amino acid transport system ATP-binding protein